MPQTRRVQEIGKSLYISLPKTWTNQMQLKRGDTITLFPQQDGSISVYPEEKKQEPRQIELNINVESEQSIKRRITGAYVDGFDIIQLRTKNRFTDEQQDRIRGATEELFGLEVVHAGLNTVTIECLLKPTLPIERTIDRIHNIIKSMFEETTSALQKRDTRLAESVPRKVSDIKRLSTVIYRALRSLILYPTLALPERISLIDSVDFLHVLHRMTGTANNIRISSESIVRMALETLPQSILRPLSEVFGLTQTMYEKAIQALISKDILLADHVLDTNPDYGKLWQLCLTANENTEISGLVFSHAQRVIDSLTQIHQYTAEIAEIAIDRAEAEYTYVDKNSSHRGQMGNEK